MRLAGLPLLPLLELLELLPLGGIGLLRLLWLLWLLRLISRICQIGLIGRIGLGLRLIGLLWLIRLGLLLEEHGGGGSHAGNGPLHQAVVPYRGLRSDGQVFEVIEFVRTLLLPVEMYPNFHF